MSFAGSKWYAPIVQDHTLVPADEPNFPLLITEGNAPPGMLDTLTPDPVLGVPTPCKADGGDLLVYLQEPAPGVEPATRYAIDVKALSLAAGPGGTCNIRVGVPNLSSSVDTTVYLVWGDATANQPARDALYGSESAQPPDTRGAWDFEQDPGGLAPQLTDASSNLNHGSTYTAMVTGDRVPGQVGNAWNFEVAKGEAVQIDDGPLAAAQQFTVQTWDEALPLTSTEFLVSKWLNGGGASNEAWGVRRLPSGIYSVVMRTSAGLFIVVDGVTAYNDSAMHHVAAVFDGANILLYVDSVLEKSVAYDGTVAPSVTFTIIGGLGQNPGLVIATKNGRQDATSVRNSPLSADSITSHYRNEKDPGSFAAPGAVQSLALALPPTAAFPYRQMFQ